HRGGGRGRGDGQHPVACRHGVGAQGRAHSRRGDGIGAGDRGDGRRGGEALIEAVAVDRPGQGPGEDRVGRVIRARCAVGGQGQGGLVHRQGGADRLRGVVDQVAGGEGGGQGLGAGSQDGSRSLVVAEAAADARRGV